MNTSRAVGVSDDGIRVAGGGCWNAAVVAAAAAVRLAVTLLL